MGAREQKKMLKSMEQKRKKRKAKSPKIRTTSAERKEQVKMKANQLAKQHKKKLLDAKLARQKQRNKHLMRTGQRVRMQRQQASEQEQQQQQHELAEKIVESGMAKEDRRLMEKHFAEDGCCKRFWRQLEYLFAGLLHFLSVTLPSERTSDWLVFLANNLGLYQEYEINDYGQRLSPRTGRPVLLSLGPIRVVQVVESANQVRSHWDPYIREYLKESKLTTDCWRANRMALQVTLCMDELGNMYDMPIREESKTLGKKP